LNSGVFLYLKRKETTNMGKLTEKQKAFCNEYLIDLNATQAAIRAGYSKKTAGQIGEQNLKKLEIKSYIGDKLEEIASKRIASATEVLEYITNVVRGAETEEVIVVLGVGDGCSETSRVNKEVSAKDKVKAAELLGKRYSLFTDKLDVGGSLVIFNGEDQLED
jgi:phage terminase small subunit